MSDTAAASQTDQGTGNGATDTGIDQKPTWIEQLPEDMRADESFHGFKTIGDLANAHKTSLSERDGLIRVPGEDATDEDRSAFNKAIGVPETPDGYELSPPEGLKEGLYNKDIEASFRAKVHELGIPASKAAELNNWYYRMMGEGDAQMAQQEQAALDESVNTLKTEWPGDKFKENSELAFRAFSKFAGEGESEKAAVQEFLEKTKIGNIAIGNHPMFLRVFANIGKTVSDDSGFGREVGGGEQSDEAKAKARFPNTKFK
jgi:hypothetical protein